MSFLNQLSQPHSKETARNLTRLGLWTLVWLVTLAIATFGPIVFWESSRGLTLGAILVNLTAGAMMILAHKRHLKGLDELQQKIQLEAMALSLGVTLITGLSYSLLDISNLISGDAEISVLVMIMSLSYMVGLLLGFRRYQ